MGNNATEGAIVQHLAKMRLRRVEAGKEVPPPLRRSALVSSNAAAASQSGRAGTARNRQASSRSKQSQQKGGGSSDIHAGGNADNEDYDMDNFSVRDDAGRRSRQETCMNKATTKSSFRSKNGIKPETTTDNGDIDELGIANKGDSDEISVPGASLLDHPNCPDENSPPFRSKEASKLVVLRYNPRRINAVGGLHPYVSISNNDYGNHQENYPEGVKPVASCHELGPNLTELDDFDVSFIDTQTTEGAESPVTNEIMVNQDGYYGVTTATELGHAQPNLANTNANTPPLDFLPLQGSFDAASFSFHDFMYPNNQNNGLLSPTSQSPEDFSFPSTDSLGGSFKFQDDNLGLNAIY